MRDRGSRNDKSGKDTDQTMADLIRDGEAGTVYDPVRRDLLLLMPGEVVVLYANEQN